MAEAKEQPPLDEPTEGLRLNLASVGFHQPDQIERIIQQARRLQVGQTHHDRDPNDQPFRITKTEDGFEFETDADVV